MTLKEIEEALKIGQVAPTVLCEYSDWLAAQASTLYDEALTLQLAYAHFHSEQHADYRSEKAVELAWNLTEDGERSLKVETLLKRIKILTTTIGRHLRTANSEAYNRY